MVGVAKVLELRSTISLFWEMWVITSRDCNLCPSAVVDMVFVFRVTGFLAGSLIIFYGIVVFSLEGGSSLVLLYWLKMDPKSLFLG